MSRAQAMKALGYALVYLPLEIALVVFALFLISVDMWLPALAACAGVAALGGLMSLGAYVVDKGE